MFRGTNPCQNSRDLGGGRSGRCLGLFVTSRTPQVSTIPVGLTRTPTVPTLSQIQRTEGRSTRKDVYFDGYRDQCQDCQKQVCRKRREFLVFFEFIGLQQDEVSKTRGWERRGSVSEGSLEPEVQWIPVDGLSKVSRGGWEGHHSFCVVPTQSLVSSTKLRLRRKSKRGEVVT